ncbi:MAG TPA: DNA mismatch repair endonuclease MutL [Candidatus Hydrogenedentes bacterium]|nr:DNA mismatch repair endonuclease MutL [Candidatus Hydrogenedentota bacterium]HPG66626.1 DNA mismatch repair endonuclease MutL [Candidatus Hydrogenedentota bacterium]
MTTKKADSVRVRVLPEDLANKIAAGEVVERPASVVKELIENALDAQATRIAIHIVAAGRRTIEVVDNGHGMSQQNALLAIERHATSKIRKAEDLDNIRTMGFRGEALPSVGAVSHMEIVTRRYEDEAGTRIRIDGGILRDVSDTAAPTGTRVTVNRLYFNTPVRAKFLKGMATELGHCIDTVQRHALANLTVGFQLSHNDKVLLDIPENASLRERVALIWGLGFANDMVDLDGELAGFTVRGLVGKPGLTRSARSHQFMFVNGRPVVNRSMQYGFQDAYRGLVTVGRYPVGIVLVDVHPRFVDVNIHPAKREVRFRDERAARDAIRDLVRGHLDVLREAPPAPRPPAPVAERASENAFDRVPKPSPPPAPAATVRSDLPASPLAYRAPKSAESDVLSVQTELPGTQSLTTSERGGPVELEPMYSPVGEVESAPLQLFDTYLLVPEDDRLLIIDQHALHERLNYDTLREELADGDYAAQQLAVPILVDVPPSHMQLLESNLDLFRSIGFEIETFGGNTFQVTAICHLYEESRVPDAIYKVLDELAQGDLFDRDDFVSDFLRHTVEACRASVKAGDRLAPEERKGLLDGFRRLRPPYTCPHGRPIITEITQRQMEKGFKRRP